MGTIEVNILNADGELRKLREQLNHVEIIREANRIPAAELMFWDGDFAKQDFELSNEADLEPGKELSIKLFYLGAAENGQDGKTVPALFKGLIVKQTLEASAGGSSGTSQLILELKSKAYLMTLRRRSRVFRNRKDSEICKQIIEEYGLQPGTLFDTANEHEEIVQYNCTDWDFLLSRADFNGLWVLTGLDADGNEVVDIIRPKVATSADYPITLGLDQPPVYNLEMEADISHQCGNVESLSWNSNTQQMTRIASAVDFQLSQGNLDPAVLSAAIGSNTLGIQSPSEVKEADLQTWADTLLLKSRLSLLRGQVSVEGNYKYQPNQTIEIKGVSGRFNGRTLLTGVRQEVGLKGWTTNLQFGQASSWFAAKADVAGPQAAAISPPINGLHIGKVEAYENDQQHRLLVKVSVPAIHVKEGIVYARLGMPYAGKGHGLFFRPEVGDEVILGFFDNDPGKAVILGSLFSKEYLPPVEDKQLDEKNNIKSWVSRQGIKMTWDETVPSLQLQTHEQGGKQTHILIGKDSVEIADVNENIIKMDSSGITIESKTAVNIIAPKVDVN